MTHRPVEPKHERVAKGVRFNVETVPQLGKALDSELTRRGASLQKLIKAFYDEKTLTKMQVEVDGFTNQQGEDGVLVSQSFSLMETSLKAFAEHYPLVLRPDDVWMLINYALAKHVDKNAEALRSKFVQHEGKKVLKVQVDHFVPGQMSPESWQQDVFPDFSRQIRQHIGEQNHDVMAAPFSTTTPASKAAHEITLMAAMKHYFSYKMQTMCGIPWIELQGTEADWLGVRERAAKVGELMLPTLGAPWMAALLPVLDEFVAAYRGQVNHMFWQSMVKKVNHGDGSGASTTISGWISILYPYLNDDFLNPYAVMPWQKLVQADGPEPDDFPSLLSSAPVEWDYFGTLFHLHFHAGMCGTLQDPETLALRPRIGWIVTHDPPQSGPERIAALEKEIDDLSKGARNYNSNDYYIQKAREEVAALKAGK